MESNEDCEACWICLEGTEGVDITPGPLHANRLIKPCRCPRVVHSVCLAKWQLSQSGRSEEKFCRFCKERLPDWQANLALPGMGAVEPVMSVHFNGQTHMVKVKPGEEGRMAFIQDVRRLLRLRDNQEFSITFECKVPGHGMFLDLKGLSSYDAAVFCAAMTAVERQRLAAQKAQKTTSLGPRGGASLPACSSAPAAQDLLANGRTGGVASSSIGSGSSRSDVGGFTSVGLTSFALPPATASSRGPSRDVPSTSSVAGSSESNPGTHQTQSRAASSASSVDSLAAGVGTVRRFGREPGDGEDGVGSADTAAGEATLMSTPFGPLRAPGLQGTWALHGLSLVGMDGVTQVGAAGPTGFSDQPAPGSSSARSVSGPQQAGSGAVRAARRPQPAGGASPAAGWGINACDSACEVEPSAATGEVVAGDPAAGSPPDTSDTGPDRRHKPVPQLRLAGSLSALADQPRRGSEMFNATWLSRLFLCASFGAGHHGRRR